MPSVAASHERGPQPPVASGRTGLFCEPGALCAQDQPTSHWARLAAITPAPDPFSARAAWQLAFRETLDPQRPAILRAGDGALAQFALHRGNRTTDHILGPIERLWLFGCNLLGPSAHHLMIDLITEIDETPDHGIHGLVIGGLFPHDRRLRFLKSALADRNPSLFRRDILCAAWLDGGVDGFLSRRSANFRRNIRRQEKKAAAASVAFATMRLSDRHDVDAVYERMQAVETLSWKGLTFQGMNSPVPRALYHALLSRLAAPGDARVILATHDGTDIGFIFGGVCDTPDGRIYRGQQCSYDVRFNTLGIGNLLHMRQIEEFCAEGGARYDMGPKSRRSMRYKDHWTEHVMPSQAWRFDL